MKNIFIGVDPGKSGFITIYEPETDEYTFYPMPEHKVETGEKSKTGKIVIKTEFNPEGLVKLVFEINSKYKGCKLYSTIEEVNGRQGWSAQNNFSFGHTAGLQMMLLLMLGAEITLVRPQKWQSYMYEGIDKIMVPSSTGKTMVHDTKATSALLSQKLRPEINFCKTERSKKIDDNKTDSFLLCIYGYKQFLKNN
jgi:hypothetical protein